jgi:hypothetical protein
MVRIVGNTRIHTEFYQEPGARISEPRYTTEQTSRGKGMAWHGIYQAPEAVGRNFHGKMS